MMTIPRFFIPRAAIDRRAGTIVYEDGRLFKQISHVLRLKEGDPVNILDDLGWLYRCRLESAQKGQFKASIEECTEIKEPARIAVHIGMPLLRSGRFEWALEKLAELGVAKISPIILKRSVVQADPIDNEPGVLASNKLDRWKTILKEAAEQCERATIPLLLPPRKFERFIKETRLTGSPLRIICAERGHAPHLAKMLGNFDRASLPNEIVIAVGAEGGFTDGELEGAISSGFVAVSLGDRILRSETAAIYALAIVASQTAAKE